MNGLYIYWLADKKALVDCHHTLITFQSSYDIIIPISVVASNNIELNSAFI